MLTITTSSNIVTCVSSAVDVALRWEKNSVVVETADTSGVYQTAASNRATLHLEDGNITEAGSYTCASATSSCNAQKTHAITVDGTPTITGIENNKCNSSLRITWKPNRAAVGSSHRIVALNSTNVTVFEISRSTETHVTEISGLNSSTQYDVEITACAATESCEIGFTVKLSGETSGITDPVTTPRLEAAESGNCVVTWDKYDKASSFTVTTQCALYQTRFVEHVSTSNRTVKTYSMVFQPLPSRRCKAFIQAKGCGKISKPVKADGICLTQSKEPDYVKPPALFRNQKENSHVIEIEKPSESNGLVSCLFVIICYENCNDKFTFEKLKEVNGSGFAKTGEGFYIAAAISMSKFSNYQYLFKPAWGNTTFCDVHNNGISNSSSMSSEIFRGQNAVVKNSANTSMFLVSATSSGGHIFLKSSSVLTIEALKNETDETKPGTEANLVTKQPESTSAGNSGLPIGLGIRLVVAPIIGIVAGYFIARSRAGKQIDSVQGERQPENTMVMTPRQVQDTSFYGYENAPSGPAYEEIKPRNNQTNQESNAYVN